MRLALLASIVFLGCAPMASVADDDQPPRNPEELRQKIERVVEKTKTPAIGIALVNRDGPYWVAGWGKADIKSDRKADENTLFRIGSISKMFAALAVLKLVEEGKLSLDDKVRDRAPDVEFQNPWEETHPVRIAHLLEHTTGWDDIHVPEYAYSAPDTMTVKQGLDFHPHSRVSRWVPGTRHAYCNAGAAVAAYIVEKVTGQRYEDYVSQTFFAPLEMTSTSYFKTSLYDERGATLYQGNQPQEYWRIMHRPAGSINSSARDMAKFVHLMLLRGSTPTTRIVSEASIDRMEVPGTTLGSAAGVLAGYGLANYTTGHKNFSVAFRGHNGGVNGGLSELVYVNELGEGYVFMINSGNGAALRRISEILKEYLLRNSSRPELPATALPAPYKELDGYYQNINPRQQSTRFLFQLMSVLKVYHDDKYLHRTPLFGGWVSNDGLRGGQALVDGWHGLPAIAIVEDPLAGPALQVNDNLYQRVPAWTVFARFGAMALMVVMTIAGFVALVVWGFRRSKKKTTDSRLMLRMWPFIASVVFFGFLIVLTLSGAFLELIGRISPLSIFIMLLSLAYPATALAGAVYLFTPKARERTNLPYWFAVAFVFVHLLIAGYLGAYGVIGFRTWV